MIDEVEISNDDLKKFDEQHNVDLSFVPSDYLGMPVVEREERWNVLNKAKDLLWQTKVDEAETLLLPFAKQLDLAMMVGFTEVALWRAALHETDEHRNTAARRLDELEAHATVAYQKLNPNRNTGILSYLIGESDDSTTTMLQKYSEEAKEKAFLDAAMAFCFVPLVKAGLEFRSGSKTGYLKGAYHIRQGWKAFEFARNFSKDLKHSKPDPMTLGLIDFGVGTFSFVMSLVPPAFKWILELIGFHGDREAALTLLSAKHTLQSTLRREATLLLVAMKNFFLDEKADAQRLLSELREQNDNSPLIFSLSGTICRNDGRVDEALDFYERAMSIEFDAPQLRATIAYHRGSCYFMKNEWSAAVEQLETFLDTTTGKVFRPYAAFRLGVAYRMAAAEAATTAATETTAATQATAQANAKTTALYKRALAWVRAHESYDEYASYRMRAYLDGSDNALALQFDAVDGLFEAHDNKRALQTLDRLAKQLVNHKQQRDLFAKFYYLKGAALKRIGQLERSEKFLRSAIGEQGKTSLTPHYCVPYALCELGELYALQQNNDAALQAWSEAKAFKGFLWEKLLSNRFFI